jgi:hypothetical protein
MSQPKDKVASADAMVNPGSLAFFEGYARQRGVS